MRVWCVVAWLRATPGSVRGAEQSDAGYVLRRAAAAERSRATQVTYYAELRLRSGAERRGLRITPSCGCGAEQSDAAAG